MRRERCNGKKEKVKEKGVGDVDAQGNERQNKQRTKRERRKTERPTDRDRNEMRLRGYTQRWGEKQSGKGKGRAEREDRITRQDTN